MIDKTRETVTNRFTIGIPGFVKYEREWKSEDEEELATVAMWKRRLSKFTNAHLELVIKDAQNDRREAAWREDDYMVLNY